MLYARTAGPLSSRPWSEFFCLVHTTNQMTMDSVVYEPYHMKSTYMDHMIWTIVCSNSNNLYHVFS